MNYYAVIDLGTNTFHLLIVKKSKYLFEEVFRKRVFVNIAEEGIETIGENCYQRGIETILDFRKIITNNNISALKIFGTAALRTATNGTLFRAEVKEKTAWDIEIIDGQREADLISIGTKAIVNTEIGNYLIMDIGGGSVEFILIKDGIDSFIQSFPIGITALYNRFKHGEPISAEEVSNVETYLDEVLKPLFHQISNLTIKGLIGASGSYEVLEKIISGKIEKHKSTRFDIGVILSEIDKVMDLTLEERQNHPEIPTQRAKLIVIAFVLMKKIISTVNFKSVIISPYALKEGALLEIINLD